MLEFFVINKLRYLACIYVLLSVVNVFAEQLISTEEAKLPAAPAPLNTRGIARGPAIKIVSPNAMASEIKGPFDLKVLFESHGGQKINPQTVKVTYLKSTDIDLTPRLAGAISDKGIDFQKAEVPPGTHSIKITVKDVEGRESHTVLNLLVAQ